MTNDEKQQRTRNSKADLRTLVLILKILVALMSVYGATTLEPSRIGSVEQGIPLDVGVECKARPRWSEPEIDWLEQRGLSPSRVGVRQRMTSTEFCWL